MGNSDHGTTYTYTDHYIYVYRPRGSAEKVGGTLLTRLSSASDRFMALSG
jgi:hypothetical protein